MPVCLSFFLDGKTYWCSINSQCWAFDMQKRKKKQNKNNHSVWTLWLGSCSVCINDWSINAPLSMKRRCYLYFGWRDSAGLPRLQVWVEYSMNHAFSDDVWKRVWKWNEIKQTFWALEWVCHPVIYKKPVQQRGRDQCKNHQDVFERQCSFVRLKERW